MIVYMIVYTTDPKDEIDGWTVELSAARNVQRVRLAFRGPIGDGKSFVFNIPGARKLADALAVAVMEATEGESDA